MKLIRWWSLFRRLTKHLMYYTKCIRKYIDLNDKIKHKCKILIFFFKNNRYGNNEIQYDKIIIDLIYHIKYTIQLPTDLRTPTDGGSCLSSVVSVAEYNNIIPSDEIEYWAELMYNILLILCVLCSICHLKNINITKSGL